jgi:hypothetical protein
MMSIKKKYVVCISLCVVAIILFVYRETVAVYLTPLLQTQFPALSENQTYLIVEIAVAILLVPSAIDILYTRFLSDRNSILRIPT